MDRVFGMPAGPLSVGLAAVLVAAVVVLTVIAARNAVFVRMGLRNVPRRRARSVLIVLGLMLGTTIITAALLTGDTMAGAVRSSVVETLGQTDETVIAGTSAGVAFAADADTTTAYFPADAAITAVDRAAASLPVDGVLAAVIEPVAAQHRAGGRTEPRVTLFAPDPARADGFGFGDVAALVPGEVLLDDEAADELAATVGSEITVLAGDRVVDLTVAGVAGYEGTGSDGPSALVTLDQAQALLGRPGEVNHVLVSNTGDETGGVDSTDTVEAVLDDAVAPLELDAQPVKQDGLDAAEEAGNAFVQLFTTFGSFSMAAGILLIFLIFVMLAAERRPEMGMARAVGTQRRHLVQTFVYEGAAYDVAAAAVGALLGIGVSFVMVQVVAAGFSDQDLDITYAFSARSLVIAYALGVLLTLVVVTLSAWRVSRLNIVSAIRDIPEPEERRQGRGRWLLVVGGVAVGALMAAGGASSHTYISLLLGMSIAILSLVPVARLVGRGERLAHTLAAVALLVLWLLPARAIEAVFGDMSMDFSIWVASGLVIVVAATWLVTYNADLLLRAAARLASPFASLRPIAKMAVAYPLKSRFRTGVTLAMFMLVVFTLVTGSTIPGAFVNSFDDVETFGGGFDVRASTAPAFAVEDLRDELPADVADDIVAGGAQSFVPVEARQSNTDRAFEIYALRGVDDGFLETTTYGMAAIATGYRTADEVWEALRTEPRLAVVDPFVVPRRDNWGVGVAPDFAITGFHLEDETFDPVPLTVQDPLTGTTVDLLVIGVLSDSAPFDMAGLTVSDRAVAPFGERARPTVHHLALSSGADPVEVAAAVEAALLTRGVEAETYEELLDDAVGESMLFIRLIQGFMALGLVVGVAALGVVSARAVVERRQQIGMLRAIGFQPEMVRRTLLAETAIVAGTAIVLGAALGLLLSYNVIDDARSQPSYAGMEFVVPWLDLGSVIVAVIVAALLTTAVSAVRAARIYPAEALRYQ